MPPKKTIKVCKKRSHPGPEQEPPESSRTILTLDPPSPTTPSSKKLKPTRKKSQIDHYSSSKAPDAPPRIKQEAYDWTPDPPSPTEIEAAKSVHKAGKTRARKPEVKKIKREPQSDENITKPDERQSIKALKKKRRLQGRARRAAERLKRREAGKYVEVGNANGVVEDSIDEEEKAKRVRRAARRKARLEREWAGLTDKEKRTLKKEWKKRKAERAFTKKAKEKAKKVSTRVEKEEKTLKAETLSPQNIFLRGDGGNDVGNGDDENPNESSNPDFGDNVQNEDENGNGNNGGNQDNAPDPPDSGSTNSDSKKSSSSSSSDSIKSEFDKPDDSDYSDSSRHSTDTDSDQFSDFSASDNEVVEGTEYEPASNNPDEIPPHLNSDLTSDSNTESDANDSDVSDDSADFDDSNTVYPSLNMTRLCGAPRKNNPDLKCKQKLANHGGMAPFGCSHHLDFVPPVAVAARARALAESDARRAERAERARRRAATKGKRKGKGKKVAKR